MNILQEEYKTRKRELVILLKEIRDNENNKNSKELGPILKGSFYLFLYNIIEATIRNLLFTTNTKIYEDKSIHFDSLNKFLKSSIMKDFMVRLSKKDPKNAQKEIDKHFKNDHISNIILSNLNQEPFLPAINFIKINELMKSYGIQCNDIHNQNKVTLQELFKYVADKRHALAHGRDSFYDVGKNKSFSDLKKDSRKIILHLNRVVKKYNEYINNESYLNVK